jgi:hypothetical protein
MAKVIDISDYKVMESAAGFYVGRSCLTAYPDGEIVPEPYDRASDYFETHEAAASYLRYISPEEPEYDVSEQQEWENYDPYC